MQSNLRVFGAELVGTTVLMLVGPGTAILASAHMGTLGVALAFGFVLVTMVYAIGHICGCHINPAVTLGFLVRKQISIVRAGYYWVAQFAGAFIGALLIWIIIGGDEAKDNTGVFAANGWGAHLGNDYGLGAVIVVEVVFTALFVFVVLSTTTAGFAAGFDGLAVGLTLGMIHLATIPVDNTSVNPARSFGTAIFGGTDALEQLWAFIVFPLVGAILGVLIWLLAHDARLEDTLLNTSATRRARDAASGAMGKAEDRLS
jgi:aquaporin Z